MAEVTVTIHYQREGWQLARWRRARGLDTRAAAARLSRVPGADPVTPRALARMERQRYPGHDHRAFLLAYGPEPDYTRCRGRLISPRTLVRHVDRARRGAPPHA